MDPPVPGCKSLDNCTFQDPDFVVWMRVAALPTFRKLHRIISTDLAPGNYTVTIQNSESFITIGMKLVSYRNTSDFPVYQFSGEKKFVISTSSWIGGKNSFLGISYLVVGSFSLFVALVFFILHKLRPRFSFFLHFQTQTHTHSKTQEFMKIRQTFFSFLSNYLHTLRFFYLFAFITSLSQCFLFFFFIENLEIFL